MNRMNPAGLGLAFAITTAILSLVCAGLVAIAPGEVAAIFQSWWHGLDVSQLTATAPPMTLQSVAIGLITITAFAFLVGFLFAVVNNVLSLKRHSSVPEQHRSVAVAQQIFPRHVA